MSFSLSSRNIHLEGTILHAECGDAAGGWPASQFHLDVVLGNDNGKFRWFWRDFQLSASDIRLEGSILHAKLNPISGEPCEASIDLDERICNRYGELTYEHGNDVYSRIGQTKTSDGAFAIENWPQDSFDLEDDERKRRDDLFASTAQAQKETTDTYFSDLSLYQYAPLLSSRSIRLVKIAPQGAPPVLVHLTIQEFDIDDAPPFAGLSYTWGNPFPSDTPEVDRRFRESMTICCNGKRLQVGRNLYEAMRRIRTSKFEEPREELYNKTQLICDSEEGHHIAVERLLREGADVHAYDKFGCTALHYAAGNGHVLIVKALVYAGSNILAIDDDGRTPLDCAKTELSYSGPWFEIQQFLDHQLKESTGKRREESCLRGQVSDAEYFWIDAICINQEDDLEKSSQVALMGEIYKKAVNAIVWLGSTYDKWDDPSLTLLQGIWTLEGARKGGQIEDAVLERMLALFDKPNPYDVVNDGYDPASFAVRDWINTFDGNSLFDGWLLGPPLFHRTWFSRVWILQEVFMSKDISVVCGQYIIPWDILIFMSSFIEGMKSSFRYKRSEQKCIIGALLVAGRSERVPALQLERWKRLFKRRGKLPMLNALQLTRNAHGTDPRDKVFSALSFSAMTHTTKSGLEVFEPNYTMTVEELYTDVGKALLEGHGPCALSLAGMRRGGKDSNFPSWAPDLRIPLAASPSGIDVEHKNHLRTISQNAIIDHTTGNLSTDLLRILPDNELQVAGLIWDTITEITPPGLRDVGNELENLATWINFLDTFEHSDGSKVQALWHTLIEHQSDIPSDLDEVNFCEWLVFHCCTAIFDLREYLHTCVQHFTIPDIDEAATTTLEERPEHVKSLIQKARHLFAALNMTFDNEETNLQRSLRTLFSPTTDIDIDADTDLYDVWEQTAPLAELFGRMIQAKDPSRRLIRLKNHGGVGAAPEMAQVGRREGDDEGTLRNAYELRDVKLLITNRISLD
ncbi:hypothetical protein N0V90_004788 [Kalmusia sp. IMI 367209]|nr:hypothetical protein N0V90_004788 [Kalmusia sp. IMI 367209]